MTRQPGWLGGWLDDIHQYCMKMAKPVLKPFRPSGSPITLVSSDTCADTDIPKETTSAGALNTRGRTNWRFLTEIAVYLGSGAKYANGCYGTLIGSHGCRIEWYHFR